MNKITKILCALLLTLSFVLIGNAQKADAVVSNQGYWLNYNPNSDNYAYSFAVIGDTQNLCRDYIEIKDKKNENDIDLKYSAEFHGIYDWLLANKDTKKIKHVFGLGDITETHAWDTVNMHEWNLAKEAISKLDGKLSYSLVRGNHDMTYFFNQTFNYPAYTNQFKGFFEDDISSSYMTMTIGETDYLFMTLNYGPSDEELEWAGKIIEEHSSHKVIITTHTFLASNGQPITLENSDRYTNPHAGTDIDNNIVRSYNNGQQMWDKLISQHGNIMLVMSGHVPSEDVLLTEKYGIHGNKVISLLVDPQYMDVDDPTGMICMLYFSEDGSEMNVEWYSTVKDKYYKEDNQYTVDLSEIGEEAHVYEYEFDEIDHWLQCNECESYTDVNRHEWVINVATGKYECYCGAIQGNSTGFGCTGSALTSIFGLSFLAAAAIYLKRKY